MINENVAIFEELLETKREELIAERLTMTEIKFATQYKISTVRVIEFLWPVPQKDFSLHGRVTLDKDVVNKMRHEWLSDMKIAKEFKTSHLEVRKQCWSRKDNMLPRLPRNPWGHAKSINPDARILNDIVWEKPVEWNEYWKKEWEVVRLWEWPISTLNEHKKWW